MVSTIVHSQVNDLMNNPRFEEKAPPIQKIPNVQTSDENSSLNPNNNNATEEGTPTPKNEKNEIQVPAENKAEELPSEKNERDTNVNLNFLIK